MTDARRLSEAMEKRRLELRMKWTQVADRADLSGAGLSAIRRGDRSPSPLTRARIEHALGWAPGSVEAILDGREPTDATAGDSSATSQLVLELRTERDRLEQGLAELDAIGASGTSAYKILSEELGRVEARLRQTDRRTGRLDETGT